MKLKTHKESGLQGNSIFAGYGLIRVFGSGLSVRIKGNDIDKLQKLAGDVADILKDTNGVTDIDDGLGDTINELKITVDKEKQQSMAIRWLRYTSSYPVRYHLKRAQQPLRPT